MVRCNQSIGFYILLHLKLQVNSHGWPVATVLDVEALEARTVAGGPCAPGDWPFSVFQDPTGHELFIASKAEVTSMQ